MMNWLTYTLGCLLSAILTGVFIGWRIVQLQRDRDQWRRKAEWLAIKASIVEVKAGIDMDNNVDSHMRRLMQTAADATREAK